MDKDDDDEVVPENVLREKYVVVLFYIGYGYCGWQKQVPDPKSTPNPENYSYIQACLENAFQESIPETIGVSACGSGRTDAGTHANGQVAHCSVRYYKDTFASVQQTRAQWTNDAWTHHCAQLADSINLRLPRAIRISHLFHFPTHFPPLLPFFHARKSATWKQYSYYIQQGGAYRVDWAPFCFYFKEKFDIEVLKRELATIKGQHDFRNFVNDSKNPPGNTVLTISCIELSYLQSLNPNYPTTTQQCADPDAAPAYSQMQTFSQPALRAGDEPPRILRLRIVGSGFMRHMVRRIIGTLQWVANGKLKAGVFARVLEDGLEHERKGVDEVAKSAGGTEDASINTTTTVSIDSGSIQDVNGMEEKKTELENETNIITKEEVDTKDNNNNANTNKDKIELNGDLTLEGEANKSMDNENGTNSSVDQNATNTNVERGNSSTKRKEPVRRSQRNKHRLNKRERKEFLGPAAPARGLWLEKVWYGEDWCLDPDRLKLDFTPFVDCSFTTTV